MAARTAVAIPQKACGKRSCPTGGYTIRPYRHGAIMAVHPVGARIARPRRSGSAKTLQKSPLPTTPLRRALRATSPQGEAYFHLEPIGNKKTIRKRNLLHLDLVYIDVKYGMHRAM